MNKIDYATDEIDNRVISLDTTKASKIEVAPLIANVTFDETTGIFTFAKKDGSTFTLDTLLEKVIVNFSFDRDTQKIILIMEDGTKEEIDLSAFIAEYEFADSGTIAFTLLENHKITAKVKEGSIEEKHLQPNYLADIKVVQAKAEANQESAEAAQTAAETAQDNAEDFAKEAEAHAVGQRGGVDVGEDDPTYQNNSKFYAEKSASDGEAWAKGTRGGVPVQSTDETYHNSAEYWANQASLQKNTFFGTCTGQGANQNKVVVISDNQNFTLKIGTVIGVKFDTNNTYSATAEAPVTLNVNSTGAKQIYGANSSTPTGTNTTFFGRANYINYYMYDGTYWVWAGSSSDNNTTYTPQALGTGYGTCATAEATTEKVVSLSGYALVRNGIVSVKFTNAVPANATMNINSRGAKNIFFQGARITADVIKAGDIATFIYDGTQYQLISIDSGTGSGSFTYTEIEYEDFLALTEEEQQTGNYIVLNWGGDTPSGGGGHTIQDQYGNILIQRSTLQFTGDVEVKDDAENEKTIVNIPKATEITWEEWQLLTDEQKETGKWDITNVPGADGTISGELLTKVWQNPSTTADFAAQNITLDVDDQSFIIWIYKISKTSPYRSSIIAASSSSPQLSIVDTVSNETKIRAVTRKIDRQSTGKFKVGDAYAVLEDGSYAVHNEFITPITAYAFKSTITLKVNAIARDVSTSASKCMLEDGRSVEEMIPVANVAYAAIVTEKKRPNGTSDFTLYSETYELTEDGYYSIILFLTATAVTHISEGYFATGVDNGNNGAYMGLNYANENRGSIDYPINSPICTTCVFGFFKKGQKVRGITTHNGVLLPATTIMELRIIKLS